MNDHSAQIEKGESFRIIALVLPASFGHFEQSTFGGLGSVWRMQFLRLWIPVEIAAQVT